MIRSTRYAVTAAIMISQINAATPAFAAKEPERLSPSSKVYLDYGEDKCRMAREFGTDKNKVTLMMDRFGPDDESNIILSGPRFKKYSVDGMMSVRFMPYDADPKVAYFAGFLGKGNPAMIVRGTTRISPYSKEEIKQIEAAQKNKDKSAASQVPPIMPITPAQEAAVTGVAIKIPGSAEMILETGSLGKAFVEMRKCTDNLLTTWGVDPAKYAGQSKAVEPITRPEQWVVSNDYPQAALYKYKRAIINFRLSVNDTGAATACFVQQSADTPEFDGIVCKALMRRAKFSPALDAQSKPMASF